MRILTACEACTPAATGIGERHPKEGTPAGTLGDIAFERGADDLAADQISMAGQMAQHRTNEELEGHEAAHWVAGQAEQQSVALRAGHSPENQRLAGLDGDSPQGDLTD